VVRGVEKEIIIWTPYAQKQHIKKAHPADSNAETKKM
jgi:hypothetical protein